MNAGKAMKELASLEKSVRDELMNQRVVLVLSSGKAVSGRVAWIGNGAIDMITPRGLVTFSYDTVAEIRRDMKGTK